MLNTKYYMHKAHVIVVFFKSYEMDTRYWGKNTLFLPWTEISGRQDNFLKEVLPDDRWDPKAPREKGTFSSKTGQFHNFFTSATLDKPGEPMKSTLTF